MLEKDELLPWLINKYNCKNGIEIGVRDADNARRLLLHTSMYLIGVDILKYPQVKTLELKFPHRFTFMHTNSISAATSIEDESLDFIYIDADHTYKSVAQDLETWYPKLKTSGVFAGDDYCNCWNPMEGQYDIVQAVEEFIIDKNVTVNISGLGVVTQEERIEYANRIGKLHEDNLMLGAVGHIDIHPETLKGRIRTEGVPVPQWWFIKEE